MKPTPRQRRHEKTRQEILDAARGVIARKGIHELTMRELAEQIDYSPAGLYEYFDSKEEIIQALSSEGHQRLSAYIRQVDKNLPPAEFLLEIGLAFIDMLPAGADLSNLSLEVQSVLLAPPADFHECETFKARWGRSERMNQLGIVADCKPIPGSTRVTITAKPQGMTEEQAQAIAGQEATGMILGPRILTRGNLVVAK